MVTIRNDMNKPAPSDDHRYEIVIAGFVSNRDRDYEILFSTNSLVEITEVYNQLLAGLNHQL